MSRRRRRAPPEDPAGPPSGPERPAFFDRHGSLVVWGLVALYVGTFFSVCLVKYRYYLYRDFDMAIFTQATDQILRGSLYSSIRGMNWLGDHTSLILFVIAPVYALFRSCLTLLFIQTLVLGLGALPIYWLARRELSSGLAAVACAALYLMHPAVGYANLYEFHPEVLATGTLLFAFYFLRAERLGLTLLFATLSLLCKEDVGLIVLMMGLYALTLRHRRRMLHAAALAGLAVAFLVLSFAVLKPMFNIGEAEYGRMYSQWGETPGRALVNMVTHPLDVVTSFFSSPADPADSEIKLQYHAHMLVPLMFLPLLSPFTLLIALPVFAEHFLSWRFQQHAIVFQYAALITPWVVVAAVMGLRNLSGWLTPRASTRSPRGKASGTSGVRPAATLALAALALSIVCSVLFGPLWGAGVFQRVKPLEKIRPGSYERTLKPYRDRMVARVPRDGGVVAGFEFLGRLAGRSQVHSIHHVLLGRYTFSTREYPVPGGVSAMIADMSDEGVLPYQSLGSGERLQTLIRTNRLRPVDAAGDQVLLVNDARDTVELCSAGTFTIGKAGRTVFDRQLAFLGFDPIEATVEPGGVVSFQTYWQRVADADRLFLMEMGVLDDHDVGRHGRSRALGYGLFPVSEWPLGVAVRETGRILIPVDMKPGTYSLTFTLSWRGEGGRGASEPDDPALRDAALRLGRVVVEKPGGGGSK